MPIILRYKDKDQRLDAIMTLMVTFLKETSDDNKAAISETMDWYRQHPELLFNFKIETFPELGMLGRITVEISPETDRIDDDRS